MVVCRGGLSWLSQQGRGANSQDEEKLTDLKDAAHAGAPRFLSLHSLCAGLYKFLNSRERKQFFPSNVDQGNRGQEWLSNAIKP
jgi:hypothetical protein